MSPSPDTQPIEPLALPEWGPVEFIDLNSTTAGLTHTYGDGLYGSGTYGDLLPAPAPEILPLPDFRPPEFLPLLDPVAQSLPVLLLKPPEFVPLPEVPYQP